MTVVVPGTGPRAVAVAGLITLLLVLSGCVTAPGADDAGAPPATTPAAGTAPLADCAGLTESPGGADPAGPPTGATLADPSTPADPVDGGSLPALTLPCFTGGEPFPLADLRGPAVVNLWASWCAPCRRELPELQRYADRAAGRVHVLGVVTGDRRDRAGSLARDLGVTFPALSDRDGTLRTELGVLGLPATVLVDDAGRLRHLHRAEPLDEAGVTALVTEHLGVSVP